MAADRKQWRRRKKSRLMRSSRIFFRKQRQRSRQDEAETENPAGQLPQKADRREALYRGARRQEVHRRETKRSIRLLLKVQHRKKQQNMQLLQRVHPQEARQNGHQRRRVRHPKVRRDAVHLARVCRDTALRPERLLLGEDRRSRRQEEEPPFRNRLAGRE